MDTRVGPSSSEASLTPECPAIGEDSLEKESPGRHESHRKGYWVSTVRVAARRCLRDASCMALRPCGCSVRSPSAAPHSNEQSTPCIR